MLVVTSDTNMAASIAEVTSLEPMNRLSFCDISMSTPPPSGQEHFC